MNANIMRAAASIALALFVLWRNLPGALLFVRPWLVRVRELPENAPEVDAELYGKMDEELAPLGFRKIGAHFEKPPLHAGVLHYDFAHEGEHAFASAYLHGEEVRLFLLTGFDDGACVLTADYRRAGMESERYLGGGLPGATPEQVLAAHRRRVERMQAAGRQPLTDYALKARVALAESWFHGAGTREMRMRHLNAFIMSAMGLSILGAVVYAVARL